ncbi:hypothetical protein OJF2_05820 [Aquisphaera giovannonii]|uniref:Uncharacterized protein n=1 Tax=Aquisphaera giovannonii TaxID=406548 RepID=A0A5B9VUP9_9BACT|nr:hypothetical protein [Aquisphaera giovannonii]QEH32113.1 hypothetical protein OJF2_05820 [Aquisphaera giovannonii]
MFDDSMSYVPSRAEKRGRTRSRREELGEVSSPRPVIQQDELDEMRELDRRLRQVEARRQQLRASLLQRLSSGAAIEAGRLTARLVERRCRILSAKKLLPLIGKAEVRRLQDLAGPTVYRSVMIMERS